MQLPLTAGNTFCTQGANRMGRWQGAGGTQCERKRRGTGGGLERDGEPELLQIIQQANPDEQTTADQPPVSKWMDVWTGSETGIRIPKEMGEKKFKTALPKIQHKPKT